MTVKTQYLAIAEITSPVPVNGNNVVKLQHARAVATLALPFGRLHKRAASGLSELQGTHSLINRVAFSAEREPVASAGTELSAQPAILADELFAAQGAGMSGALAHRSLAGMRAVFGLPPRCNVPAISSERLSTAEARLELRFQPRASAAAKHISVVRWAEHLRAQVTRLFHTDIVSQSTARTLANPKSD